MGEVSGVRAAIGAVAATTATVLPVFLTGGLAVQIGAEFELDPARLGLVVALFFAVSAVASLPAGRLVERFGPGVTSRAGVAGSAVVMLAVAGFARSFPTLLVVLLCGAWCNVLAQLAANVTLARHVPPHRLGLSFGVKQAAIPLATLLAGLAVPAVALTLGWRWAYVIGAGLAAAALLVAPSGPGRPARAAAARADQATGALSVIGLAAGLAAAAASALGVFLVASAVERGVPAGTAGLTLTLGSVVGLTLRLLHGWLADRRSGANVTVVAASLLAGSAGLALLAVPGTPALVVGTVLGFGLGWAWPGLLQFAVVRLHPAAPAAATSIVQVGVYGGAFAGPVGFGLLAAHASFPAAWLTGSAVMLVAAGLMVLGRRMLVVHRARLVARQVP
ncbi:MAG TPA: MFS transporter [Pseudonocardia sp.]|nr:MFS transporter [Pseudonocardia sp.]